MAEYQIKDDWEAALVSEDAASYDYISPMSDFFFKNFFANGEKTKENLLILLNAILHDQLGFERITDVKLDPTEDKAENPMGKTTFYDIHCTTSSGHKLIVEMQNQFESNFQNRMLYYGIEAIARQDMRARDERRLWNFDIVPVVTIAMCDFSLPGFSTQQIAYFNMRDVYTNKVYGDQLQLVFIHMTEFTDDPQKCKTELEKIVFSLKNMETIQRMEKVPFSEEEGDFYSRLAKMSRISALDPTARKYYDRWLKHEYDIYLREEKMKIKAQEEGMAKGKVEGKWETARNLHGLGVDLETISKATGISIEKLKERFN